MLRRSKEFEVRLKLMNEQFIKTPRPGQRTHVINQVLNECVAELKQWDELASGFIRGTDVSDLADRSSAALSEQEIMEDWQIPIMQAMADIATAEHGDVLEIGFGRGVSATMVQEGGVRSHTLVECNDFVVESIFGPWKDARSAADIRMIHARWQDAVDQMDLYDGVLFHTYPLNQEELAEYALKSSTFAEHFFATAAAKLRPGGVFTYLSHEVDSLGRAHQRALFEHFQSVKMSVVRDLKIPDDSRDAWWCDSMVIVEAVR